MMVNHPLFLHSIICIFQAYVNMRDLELAKKDFTRVVELDPNNKAAKNQLAITIHKIKQEKEKEKKTYGGMFAKFAEADLKVRIEGFSQGNFCLIE